MWRVIYGILLGVAASAGIAATTLYLLAWRQPANSACSPDGPCTLPNRLKAATETALKAGGADWVKVRFVGRDAFLAGEAASEREVADSAAVVWRVDGVRAVDTSALKLAPLAAPFRWSVVKSADGRVVASGAVPGHVAGRALAEELQRVFGAAATNEAVLRRGGPPGNWFAAAKFGIEIVATMSEGQAVLVGQILEIGGRFREDAGYEAATRMLSGRMPQGYSVRSATVSSTETTFTWRFVRDGGGVMSGAMTAAARPALVEAGRAMAGPSLRDATVLRPNGPPGDWVAAARLGMELAMRLENGSATLTDMVLEIKGIAADEAALAAASQALKVRLPVGYSGRAQIDVAEAKPFVWRMTKEIGGRGAMSGAAPNEQARAALLAAGRAAIGPALVDQSAIRRGVPAGNWLQAARLATALLGRLEDGSAILTDTALEIRGRAKSNRISDAITADLAGLPAGYTGKTSIRLSIDDRLEGPQIAKAEECQAIVQEVMADAVIDYETDGTTVSPASEPLLDKVALALQRCRALRVVVDGYTDNIGSDFANKVLSERRAAAVAGYLVAAGVARERLTVQGHGSAKPVADNATEQGRARNRRIEFTVKARD